MITFSSSAQHNDIAPKGLLTYYYQRLTKAVKLTLTSEITS